MSIRKAMVMQEEEEDTNSRGLWQGHRRGQVVLFTIHWTCDSDFMFDK
jgi:hypothetical protein